MDIRGFDESQLRREMRRMRIAVAEQDGLPADDEENPLVFVIDAQRTPAWVTCIRLQDLSQCIAERAS